MDIAEARKLLPKIGERRMEVPTFLDKCEAAAPQRRVVVQVSEWGLWYRVRFESTGRCECYKVPRVDK